MLEVAAGSSFRPLQMLPLVLFMIFYKSLWLAVVAYPLWSSGQLEGSAAEGMARVFVWVPLPILLVPWGHVVRTYLPFRRKAAQGRASGESQRRTFEA